MAWVFIFQASALVGGRICFSQRAKTGIDSFYIVAIESDLIGKYFVL